MIAYASSTGTKRNRAALAAAGWRLFVTPETREKPGGFRYALDNGAWTAFATGRPWDEAGFLRLVDRLGAGADFLVLPDIVAGGLASLDLSLSWAPRLAGACPLLLAVQNGMDKAMIAPLVGPRLGLFVGGDTPWKEATMATWGRVARETGAYLHIGRVNSARRIALCAHAGADSFDGSSVSRYAVTLPRMDNARRQLQLALGDAL